MSFTYTTPGTPTVVTLTSSQVNFQWGPSTLIAGANIVLLMHMDVSPPVDSSGRGNVLTNNGMIFDTGTPKFGAGDFKSTSTSTATRQCITAPITAASALDILSGSGDFTIEGWFKLDSASIGIDFVIVDYGSNQSSFSNSGGLVFSAFNDASGGISVHFLGSPTDSGSTAQWGIGSLRIPTATPGTWYHWALIRQSGVGKAYFNGQVVSMGANPWSGYAFPATSFFATGWTPIINGSLLPGSVDEIQVTKGVAVYTAAFTPPTAPFPTPGNSDAYTVFRDGAPLAGTFGGIVSFTDYGVPGDVHVYKVAAQDGVGNLTSDFSGNLTITFPGADGRATGKFAGAVAYPPFVLANAKGIIPKIYMPLEDVTARSKKK